MSAQLQSAANTANGHLQAAYPSRSAMFELIARYGWQTCFLCSSFDEADGGEHTGAVASDDTVAEQRQR